MGKPQIITTESGEELVVLSRREYEALAARQVGGKPGQPAAGGRIRAQTAGDVPIPESVLQEIEAAPSPIGPLREWRGLTQSELAAAAGISQGYLSALEAGRKGGDAHTLHAIARTLDVGLDALTG